MTIELAILSTILTATFWTAGALAVIILGWCVLPSVIRRRPRRSRDRALGSSLETSSVLTMTSATCGQPGRSPRSDPKVSTSAGPTP